MSKEELKELSRKFNNELALQLLPSNDAMVAATTARRLFEEHLVQYTAELKKMIEGKKKTALHYNMEHPEIIRFNLAIEELLSELNHQ